MKRTAFVWWLLLTAISASDASAQTVLRTADSTQIYVAALRAVLDSLVRRNDSVRIWIRPGRIRDQANPSGFPGAEAFREIQRTFPSARLVEENENLFLCPPGVQVRMPGSGCPMRDDGFAVQIGLKAMGDSIVAEGWLTQSTTRGARTSSGMQVFEVVFYRAAEVWKFIRVQVLGRT